MCTITLVKSLTPTVFAVNCGSSRRLTFLRNGSKKGSQLAVFKTESDSSPLQSVTVASARQHKGFTLLTFEGYDDINAVLPFKGTVLKVDEAQLTDNDLSDGEYYYHQIIGLTVVDQAGNKIGTVKEIMAPGANDVWVVSRPGQSELLLPVIKQVVKKSRS